jgi:hypothetical protein
MFSMNWIWGWMLAPAIMFSLGYGLRRWIDACVCCNDGYLGDPVIRNDPRTRAVPPRPYDWNDERLRLVYDFDNDLGPDDPPHPRHPSVA